MFVEPNELIEGDLVASQSESLKEDVRCEELHLCDELRNLEYLITAHLARDWILHCDVIRAYHKLKLDLWVKPMQMSDERGDFKGKSARFVLLLDSSLSLRTFSLPRKCVDAMSILISFVITQSESFKETISGSL